MAISDPNDKYNREKACEFIDVWLSLEGLSVRWIEIVREFDSLREIYQTNPRKRFGIPMFEIECIFKRIAYRYGK